MSSSNLIRWGGLAAMVGGVLFVIAELLNLVIFGFESVSEFAPASSEITPTGYFILQQAPYLIGATLLLIGLVGLYAHQSEAAGPLGLVGFLAAFVETVLLVAGFAWASAEWAGVIFQLHATFEGPGLFDAFPLLPLFFSPLVAFFLTFITVALGWLLFGIASLRSRVYPRAASILLIIGAVLLVAPLPLASILFDVAVAWLGFVLFTGRDTSAEQPARVS